MLLFDEMNITPSFQYIAIRLVLIFVITFVGSSIQYMSVAKSRLTSALEMVTA